MEISAELLQQLLEHAREEAPDECCGIIGVEPSENGEDARRALVVHRAVNKHKSRLSFEIDGLEVLKIERSLDDAALQMGAIYHSHTRTAPFPSQTDINFAALWPGVEWVIVGLADPDKPEIRSYLIEEGKVREVALAPAPA